MRRRLFGYAQGFTLLEIIITMTVTAVLATMIYTYFGKAFTESVTSITRLKSSAALQQVMENIKGIFLQLSICISYSCSRYANGGRSFLVIFYSRPFLLQRTPDWKR